MKKTKEELKIDFIYKINFLWDEYGHQPVEIRDGFTRSQDIEDFIKLELDNFINLNNE